VTSCGQDHFSSTLAVYAFVQPTGWNSTWLDSGFARVLKLEIERAGFERVADIAGRILRTGRAAARYPESRPGGM